MPTATTKIRNLADLQKRLGGVPLDRIRFQPAPGSATVEDVLEVQAREGVICELVEGVLLEKTVGYTESRLAGFLLELLNAFVRPRNLGIVTGMDGTIEQMPGLVRIPDVAFVRWDRLPGRCAPSQPVPPLAPNLAVEVLSRSNTPGEMTAKRNDYFSAGVELVWEVDAALRIVEIFTAVNQSKALTIPDTLDGAPVLPGFTLALHELFGELDRHG